MVKYISDNISRQVQNLGEVAFLNNIKYEIKHLCI